MWSPSASGCSSLCESTFATAAESGSACALTTATGRSLNDLGRYTAEIGRATTGISISQHNKAPTQTRRPFGGAFFARRRTMQRYAKHVVSAHLLMSRLPSRLSI